MKTFHPFNWLRLSIALSLICGDLCAQDPFKNEKAAPPPKQATIQDSNVRLRLEVFSLPIRDARRVILIKSNGADQYSETKKLLEEDKARLERLLVIPSATGRKVLQLGAIQLRLATEYGIPFPGESPAPDTTALTEAGKKAKGIKPPPATRAYQFSSPAKFETQDLGNRMEFDAVLLPDDKTVDMNLSVDLKKLLGTSKAEEGAQPIIQVQKIITSISATLGVPFCLGTLNPPTQTGVEGDNKENVVWLAFVTMTH